VGKVLEAVAPRRARDALAFLELRPPPRGRTTAFVSCRWRDEPHKARLEQQVDRESWELRTYTRLGDEDWRAGCERMIRDSDAVICLVGDGAGESQGIDWEIRTALELRKPLVAAYVSHARDNVPALVEAGVEPHDNLEDLARSLTERVMHHALFGHVRAPRRDPDEGLIEQYKLLLQTSENLEARRQGLHTFFMSINTLFLGAVALIARESGTNVELAVATVLLAIFGFSLCGSWRRLIDSYRAVRSSKFDLIRGLETQLPAAPFVAEWISLSQSGFVSFTTLERRTPTVFQCLYVLAALAGIATAVL